MTYQPIVPLAGYAGWTFLTRTMEQQTESFAAAPANARDMEYFRENIGQIVSAEELVSDFRLLRVALGAFGLQDDLPNKAFVRAVLGDGTTDNEALSNRLADKRYAAFSEAFGFGEVALPKTLRAGFANTILAKFERQAFEVAVGEQSSEMRFALTLQRELPEIAAAEGNNDTAWLRILGNPPLRTAFQTALGLPESIAFIDIDKQVEAFRDRAASVFGTDNLAELSTEEGIEDVIQNYLGRAQLNSFANVASPASIALTLLAPLA